MKRLALLFLVCCLSPLSSFYAQDVGRTGDVKLHIKETEVIWNGRANSVRRVYLLVDEAAFTTEKIKQIVAAIAEKFPSPQRLSVLVFTEADRLSQTKIDYFPGLSVSFLDTPAGREAAKRFEEELAPKPIGFYANYYRGYDEERLAMTLAKDDADLVSIGLETYDQPEN